MTIDRLQPLYTDFNPALLVQQAARAREAWMLNCFERHGIDLGQVLNLIEAGRVYRVVSSDDSLSERLYYVPEAAEAECIGTFRLVIRAEVDE
ncbi:MAG: hypothetical protein Rubg2KO_15430 [Rubricoccaceae bacterium]